LTPVDRLLRWWRVAKARRYVGTKVTVIDIGCDDGYLFRRLGDRLARGLGYDPSIAGDVTTPRYRLCRAHFPTPACPPGAADVVTALAVVEHIPDDAQAAFWDAVADALRPGGRCILTVPAPVVDHILAGLIRLRLANGMHAEEHYGFAPRSVASRAAAAGLAVERHVRFQLGCNHLFVLRKPPTSPAA
jgi:SAM-dependent methyltransferase